MKNTLLAVDFRDKSPKYAQKNWSPIGGIGTLKTVSLPSVTFNDSLLVDRFILE